MAARNDRLLCRRAASSRLAALGMLAVFGVAFAVQPDAFADPGPASDVDLVSSASSNDADATEQAVVERCADVPEIVSDVIGDSPVGNIDPIFLGVVNSYANEHRDTFGGLWIDRNAGGTLVVAFTDDPEPHRAALAARRPTPDDDVEMYPPPPIVDDRPIGEWDQTLDVVQVDFSSRELGATQNAIEAWLATEDVVFNAVGPDLLRNRIRIELRTSDPDALAALALVVPADQLCDDTPASYPGDAFRPGDPLDVIVTPAVDGEFPPDTLVSCGQRPNFELGALEHLEPLTEENNPELHASVQAVAAALGPAAMPGDGWSILTQSDSNVDLIHIDGDNVAFLTLEATQAGWNFVNGSGPGPCTLRIVLPTGLNIVEWELDPHQPTDPESSVINVLATEQACAGGAPMGDRLLGPQIVETEHEIRIAFAAISQPGAQECPGNPAQPVQITLEAPVGSRAISDGVIITTNLTDLVNPTN